MKKYVENKNHLEVYALLIKHYPDSFLKKELTRYTLQCSGAILCFDKTEAQEKLKIIENEIQNRNIDFQKCKED